MKLKKLSTTALIALALASTACDSRHSLSSLSRDGLSAGIDANATTTPLRTQKMRIRDDGANGKVFEYKDPRSTDEKWVAYGKIEIFPKGTQFHHWGPKQDVQHWATAGITKDEIDRAVRNYDATDVIGGGFYISLSPVDSADYGTNQIVAESRHDVISLNLTTIGYNYNRNNQTLKDNATGVELYVPDIAAAGIETMHYNGNWMVSIQATVLEHLFEGSWPNFISRAKTAKYDLATIMKFSTKYPLTKDITSRADFREAFPVLAKSINNEPISSEELSGSAKAYIDSMSTGMFSVMMTSDGKFLTDIEPWKTVLEVILKQARTEMVAKFKDATQKNDLSTLNLLMSQLDALKMTVKDILPDFTLFMNPDLKYQGLISLNGIAIKNVDQRLRYSLCLTSIYEIMARAKAGASDVESLLGIAKGEKSLFEKITGTSNQFSWSDPMSAFNTVATTMGITMTFRDQPLTATGDYELDGPGKPGYLKITASQKEALAANIYITPTFKEIVGSNGQKEIYAQYEYPTAAHYKKFASKIQDAALLQKLADAEKNGDLNAPSSQTFKDLTVAVLKELAGNSLKSRGFMGDSSLMADYLKIHPFADSETNLNLTSAYVFQRTYRNFMLFNPEWAKIATPLELTQLYNQSNDTLNRIYIVLTPTSGSVLTAKPVDLDTDIGYWEVASNTPPPHKDNQKFIQAMKARFDAPEIQQAVKDRKYGKVYEALHAAGAGQ